MSENALVSDAAARTLILVVWLSEQAVAARRKAARTNIFIADDSSLHILPADGGCDKPATSSTVPRRAM
jgi:hypothetical protein